MNVTTRTVMEEKGDVGRYFSLLAATRFLVLRVQNCEN